jgi:hypothetical protein
MTTTTTTIRTIDTGSRTVCGTDWPVRTIVQREALPGRPVRWVVARGVCNGTADGSAYYRTRREAFAAAKLVEVGA